MDARDRRREADRRVPAEEGDDRRPERQWRAHHLYYHGDLDRVLIRFVRPAVGSMLAEGLIDRFFFIRYTLGGPHVRLRYRLTSANVEAADRILRRIAAELFERYPSTSSLDPEAIRRHSEMILAQVPEVSELIYPDNTLLHSTFEPEVERYGGKQLLPHSLDFFTVSSAQALEAVAAGHGSPGRQRAITLCLLLRQAWGFADSDRELLALLSYRLPVGDEVADTIWEKGDTAFEKQRDRYGSLVRRELEALAEAEESSEEPAWLSAAFYARACRRLSWQIRGVEPGVRWEIGHSQVHMTANRLGSFPPEEMYLERILWRALREMEESDPETWQRWRRLLSARRKSTHAAPLEDLLEPVLRHFATAD